jgi:hypothetical protein
MSQAAPQHVARVRTVARITVGLFVTLFAARVIAGWLSNVAGHDFAFDNAPGVEVFGASLFTFTLVTGAAYLVVSIRSRIR